MLFDAHTHLNFEKYSEEERAELAAEIAASDVSFIIDVADCVASAKQALADSAAYDWCYAAVGIHPDHASDYKGVCSTGAAADKTQSERAGAAADKTQPGDTDAGAANIPSALPDADSADSQAALPDTDAADSQAALPDMGASDSPSGRLDADIDIIRKLAADRKAVAIGEIGLDYYYGTDDREEQQELFRRQIRLANEMKLPIMIHSRDAHQLTMDILKEEGAFSDERKTWFPGRPAPGALAPEASGSDLKMPDVKGAMTANAKAADAMTVGAQADVNSPGEHLDGAMRLVPDARVQMHCFSGSPELALEYVKLGATISLGGPVTFKNGKKAAEVARRVPIEFLMSETDAPYMAPEPLRGRPNKSPYIEHIVRRISILKGIEYEEAARILTENGKRFFNIPK